MESIKKLSLIGLVITLVLTSCSIEKRAYMSGYHIEWNRTKHNYGKQELANKDNVKQKQQIQIVTNGPTEQESNTINYTPLVSDNNFTASLDHSVVIPSSNTVSLEKNVHSATPKINATSEKKTVVANKKALKSTLKELNAKSYSGDDGGSGALRSIGWVVLILGILILLFASILAGALLMLLGLVFIKAGKKSEGYAPQTTTNSNNSQYVDVVYLKNGGVIRGMIIEQTPNESLKIQTKDGSIFVYKMDEVDRMTKELSR